MTLDNWSMLMYNWESLYTCTLVHLITLYRLNRGENGAGLGVETGSPLIVCLASDGMAPWTCIILLKRVEACPTEHLLKRAYFLQGCCVLHNAAQQPVLQHHLGYKMPRSLVRQFPFFLYDVISQVRVLQQVSDKWNSSSPGSLWGPALWRLLPVPN